MTEALLCLSGDSRLGTLVEQRQLSDRGAPHRHPETCVIVLKYGPFIWALTVFFLVYVGINVWALIGLWYIIGI